MKVVKKALDKASWRSLKGRYKGSGARQEKNGMQKQSVGLS